MQTRRWLLVNSLGTALTAGALSFRPTNTLARAAIIGEQAPGFYRFRLRAYEITAISDGTINLPMSKIYRNITERDAEAYLADRFQSHPSEFSVNAFLVNTGERLVLIDTGTGKLMGPSLGKAALNIQAAGYVPSQIDDIILTHIHADHSGGLIANGARVFENAVVRVNRREERFWLSADVATRSDPILGPQVTQAESCLGGYVDAGRLDVFDDDGDPIPGFKSVLRAGHTPGHSSIMLESEGQTIVFWGDIVHGDALQYDHPEVTVDFDVDQTAAAATRALALADAADRQYFVAGAHHSFPGIGHVRRNQTNYSWQPLAYDATY